MGRRVEISDSIELCIVELTRVDCIYHIHSFTDASYLELESDCQYVKQQWIFLKNTIFSRTPVYSISFGN